jgi:hypothetical protein
MMLGFMAARFVKATSADRYRTTFSARQDGYLPLQQTAVPTAGGPVGVR